MVYQMPEDGVVVEYGLHQRYVNADVLRSIARSIEGTEVYRGYYTGLSR